MYMWGVGKLIAFLNVFDMFLIEDHTHMVHMTPDRDHPQIASAREAKSCGCSFFFSKSAREGKWILNGKLYD